MGVGLPDFRERQAEKWGQNWENVQFPRNLKMNFYCLSLNGKNTPHFTILTPIPSLTLELSQKTPKNYVFKQIFNHSLNFEPSPPLISGLNSKFDYATSCVLNGSLASQNFVLKSFLYQKVSRRNLWGGGSA